MKHFSVSLFTFIIVFSLGFSVLKGNDEEIFSPKDHCVAYLTPEKILFFPKYFVIGKSCNINTWTENDGNKFRFFIDFPLSSLNSGINARDKDIMELLEADKYPNLLFITEWFSKDKINEILSKGQGEVNGILKVAGREYSISTKKIFFLKNNHNYSITGTIDTNYNFFNLNPPKLWGFVEVLNYIKIIFNLQSDQITDFESTFSM